MSNSNVVQSCWNFAQLKKNQKWSSNHNLKSLPLSTKKWSNYQFSRRLKRYSFQSNKAKLGRCVLGVFFCFQKERKQEEVLQNQFVKSGARKRVFLGKPTEFLFYSFAKLDGKIFKNLKLCCPFLVKSWACRTNLFLRPWSHNYYK